MDEYISKQLLIRMFNAKADMALGTPKVVFSAAAKMVEKLPAADAQESSHWISVKKNLPQNGLARVLALLKNEKITDGIGFPRIDTDRCIDGKWVRWSSHVTHWMPLPNTAHQIPKGAQE